MVRNSLSATGNRVQLRRSGEALRRPRTEAAFRGGRRVFTNTKFHCTLRLSWQSCSRVRGLRCIGDQSSGCRFNRNEARLRRVRSDAQLNISLRSRVVCRSCGASGLKPHPFTLSCSPLFMFILAVEASGRINMLWYASLFTPHTACN